MLCCENVRLNVRRTFKCGKSVTRSSFAHEPNKIFIQGERYTKYNEFNHMEEEFLDHISESLPTVVVGALVFSFSLSVSKAMEYTFKAAFGEMDTLLKHVTYVFVCCTMLFVITALASKK